MTSTKLFISFFGYSAKPGGLACLVIPFLTMLCQVQTGGFDFPGNPEAQHGLDDEGNDYRSTHREHKGDSDGFDLFKPERMADDAGEIGVEIRVDHRRRQHSREKCAERSANRMDTECIQGVVITEPSLDLPTGEIGNQPGGNS